jgi:hypothetical protein
MGLTQTSPGPLSGLGQIFLGYPRRFKISQSLHWKQANVPYTMQLVCRVGSPEAESCRRFDVTLPSSTRPRSHDLSISRVET